MQNVEFVGDCLYFFTLVIIYLISRPTLRSVCDLLPFASRFSAESCINLLTCEVLVAPGHFAHDRYCVRSCILLGLSNRWEFQRQSGNTRHRAIKPASSFDRERV
jgi:hypothetical protein